MAVADVTQTTAASQPLLLAHSGVNYWFSPRVAGNYCVTPNAAANRIVGDIEDIYYLDINNIINFQGLFTCQDSGGYNFYISSSGRLVFDTTTRGVATSSISISTGLQYLKFNRNASNGEVKFYTSSDGITYTQLGTTQSTTSGNLTASALPLTLGIFPDFISFPFQNKIYRATRSNSIGGTPVVDFNPASYNASTSQTAWTSATGEVWTINTGTAITGYKGCIISRTIIQGDGVDDTMVSGTLTSMPTWTDYLSFNPLNLNTSKYYLGSSTTDVNIIYYSPSALRFGNNTSYAELNLSGVVANKLMLATALSAGASSLVLTNNANQVSGTVGTAALTTIKIFAPSGVSLFGNGVINSLVVSSTADNSTVRTAMYNIMKTINNSAF